VPSLKIGFLATEWIIARRTPTTLGVRATVSTARTPLNRRHFRRFGELPQNQVLPIAAQIPSAKRKRRTRLIIKLA
jgi:hypothetical protein